MKFSRPRAWIIALIAAALICCVAWMSVEIAGWYANTRVAARYTGMKLTALSLANYADAHGVLPVAAIKDESGTELSSWRLAVLPFSPAEKRGDLSLPWNEGTNLELTKHPAFFCFRNKESLETSVFAVAGPGTAFDPNVRTPRDELPDDAILLVEVCNSGVPWGSPGDLEIGETGVLPTLLDGEDFHIAFADLSVWQLRSNIPVETLRHFFLIDGARTYDRDQLLAPHRIDSE